MQKQILNANTRWTLLNPNTITGRYLAIYQDLLEHCDTCVAEALGSTQPAARAKNLRDRGYVFKKHGNNYVRSVFCETCGKSTPHRQLESAEPVNAAIHRAGWTAKFVERVKKVHANYDEIERRTLNPAQLEIDHRVPHIRFEESEQLDEDTITDDEIRERYMLLKRDNNLLKSRACERCERDGKRQASRDGVNWFYEGSEDFTGSCVGCFWHNPNRWTDELNQNLLTNA